MVLETLFKRRQRLARHMAAPMLLAREAFLSHLHRQGANRSTLARYAPVLIQVSRFLGLTTLRDVELREVYVAAKRWRSHRGLPRLSSSNEYSELLFTWLAKRWLRFHGKLKLPPRPVEPFAIKLTGYADFMRYRGLAQATVRGRYSQAAQFLRWFSRKHRRFASIRLNDVDKYIALRRENGYRPTTIATITSCLRSFFGYAASRRWCDRAVAQGIERPSVPRPRFMRHGPNWREVKQALRTLDSRPADVRARAILSLLAVYALRAGEVTRLLLTDLEWKTRILHIGRSKRGRLQRFPIQREVGDAVSDYITKVRPRCSCPNVFVTLHPPFRPVTPATIWNIVNLRFRRLGITSRPCGAHCLRHACATNLLERGSSLKQVSDFLGHRDIRSTSLYARCDMKSLRAVADLDLKWLR